MGCCSGILKCLLIFFNVILGVIGLILLAAGIFVKVGAQKYIDQFAGDALKGLMTLPGQYYSNSTSATNAPPSLDLNILLEPVATGLIVFGIFLAVISFLGTFGACCSSKCLLATYTTAVLLIMLIEIILAAVVLTGGVDEKIKGEMLTTLVQNYVDIDAYDLYSLAWNFVMLQFKCCGLNDYTDFNSAVKWTRTRSVIQAGVQDVTVNLTTPVACCKFDGTFPSIKIINEQCAITPTDQISNWKSGCWNGVTTFLGQYRSMIVGIICGIIFFELILAIIAIIIICTLNSPSKVSP